MKKPFEARPGEPLWELGVRLLHGRHEPGIGRMVWMPVLVSNDKAALEARLEEMTATVHRTRLRVQRVWPKRVFLMKKLKLLAFSSSSPKPIDHGEQ